MQTCKLLLLLFCLIIGFSSCFTEVKTCKQNCENGYCDENGVCNCLEGYSGQWCENGLGGGSTNCANTCIYANDGECDDGGPGSITSLCPCATDCADCGTRTAADCGGGGGGGGGGSGGGGGGSGGGSFPPTGTIYMKVYNPTGNCANPNDAGYYGTVTAYYHDGSSYFSTSVGRPGGFGQYDSQGLYWDGTYGLVPPLGDMMYKIEWDFRPTLSSFPNSCKRTGSVQIDYQGQQKNAIITW